MSGGILKSIVSGGLFFGSRCERHKVQTRRHCTILSDTSHMPPDRCQTNWREDDVVFVADLFKRIAEPHYDLFLGSSNTALVRQGSEER